MSEDGTQLSRSAESPDRGSWAFWRKRLARALIFGGLAVALAELLPALPEDQILLLEPPAGVKLTRAQLTYFSAEDGDALIGTELTSSGTSASLAHSVRLPNSEYRVSVVASGTDAESREHSYTLTRTVALSGKAARLFLKPSKPAP